MEEDIKILEEYIKDLKLTPEELLKSNEVIKFIEYKEIKAIENLIARYKELDKIVKTYNTIPNDYMPNDVKIVIADREYFNNGILKENCIPKSKVKEKIEELEKLKDVPHELDFKAFYRIKDLRNIEIGVLQELLED